MTHIALGTVPGRYLTGAPARPNVPGVKADYDAKTRSLMRLAQLLQRRYRSTTERSFVMLMADIRRHRPAITGDAMVTQPIPRFSLG